MHNIPPDTIFKGFIFVHFYLATTKTFIWKCFNFVEVVLFKIKLLQNTPIIQYIQVVAST